MKKIPRNKTVAKTAFLMLTILITMTNCDNEVDVGPPLTQQHAEGMMKLGEKLVDPFTVENMKIAFNNLKGTNSIANKSDGNFEVKPTHFYIKFIPKNEAELSILKIDSDLVLYDYPLDVKIENKGYYYHDPEVPQGQPTYQYCAVPIDKILPTNVEYEILKELHLPHKLGNESKKQSSEFINDLLDESFKITSNINIVQGSVSNRMTTPKGRIRVWDDRSNSYVGVKGAFVRVTGWYDTTEGEIGSDGYFELSRGMVSRRGFEYSIKWEKDSYSIRTKLQTRTEDQAYLIGPNSGDWNLDIVDDHVQQLFAFIHLGSYRYFYEDILGLKRPINEYYIPEQIKIAALDEVGNAFFNSDHIFGNIQTPLGIYRYRSAGVVLDCETLYNAVLHELAHASHWEFRQSSWQGNTDRKLKESWAVGVAWSLTKMRYSDHDQFELMRFSDMLDPQYGNSIYTPLIIDLIDSTNQGIYSLNLPYDRVSGYSIAQIEDVLADCENILDLRDNLKNTYNNPTELYLDELFEQYQNLTR